jgi:hypothetical protein
VLPRIHENQIVIMIPMRKVKKNLVWIVSLLIPAAIVGEIGAKYYLGLGTPPLVVTHPRIEYMFKPNQDVYRFGNHFITNQYGMRTEPFNSQKINSEFRVMVFGDSVLNGGNLTDHSALSTTILKNKLSEVKGENVVVGNISAGSWGPGNWLAYAKEYGFFGANVVVLVISSHDYADNPTFESLNPNTHPTAAPISALFEGATRYLPRYLPVLRAENNNTIETDKFIEESDEKESQKGLGDLKSFLEIAKSNSNNVLVLQHWEKLEIDKDSAHLGNEKIKMICEHLRVSCVSLKPYFSRSMKSGINPYRDNIHPNKIGQELISEAIFVHLSKVMPITIEK